MLSDARRSAARLQAEGEDLLDLCEWTGGPADGRTSAGARRTVFRIPERGRGGVQVHEADAAANETNAAYTEEANTAANAKQTNSASNAKGRAAVAHALQGAVDFRRRPFILPHGQRSFGDRTRSTPVARARIAEVSLTSRN